MSWSLLPGRASPALPLITDLQDPPPNFPSFPPFSPASDANPSQALPRASLMCLFFILSRDRTITIPFYDRKLRLRHVGTSPKAWSQETAEQSTHRTCQATAHLFITQASPSRCQALFTGPATFLLGLTIIISPAICSLGIAPQVLPQDLGMGIMCPGLDLLHCASFHLPMCDSGSVSCPGSPSWVCCPLAHA